jgi:putative transposase
MKLRKTNYKLYPGQRQSARLLEVLRLQQQLYNAALQERIDCYRKTGKSISYNHQQASLTQIRADHPEYKAVPVYISRMTLRRLDKAFKAFFSRVKKGQAPGFPRFRPLSRFSSFEMCAGSDRTHQCDCGCTLPRDAASGLVAIQWALGLGRNASYAGHSAKPIPSKAWCR